MKKASLSLSITAIVVIVIAFVVLGLGLSLTRNIFKGAEGQLGPALELTALEAEANADNPITIPDNVELGVGKSDTMSIEFYNRGESTAEDATFKLAGCIDQAGADVADADMPTITSIATSIGKSTAGKFKVIMENENLGSGTYICTIQVVKKGDTSVVYEKKQFFLNVVS